MKIEWVDEELVGEPIYSIINVANERESLVGVHFRLENEVLTDGTAFCSENMGRIAQKAGAGRFFYYDGADVEAAPFMPARDGVREGVVLARCYAGSYLNASGVVYLETAGRTDRIVEPVEYEIGRDGTLFCQVGREVFGSVIAGQARNDAMGGAMTQWAVQ